MIENFWKKLRDPSRIPCYLMRHTARLWGDKSYLSVFYFFKFGKRLRWGNPQTYNEKLNWLKLNCRRKDYTQMVDKYEVKNYLSQIGGGKFKNLIIPTLGIWDDVEQIPFDELPNQFVLKCTHDSGGLVVCHDKSKLDVKAAKRKLRHGLEVNYYFQTREYPYLEVKPRIIAEQYIEGERGCELNDYKFFCFDGEPKFLYVATDGRIKGEEKLDYFDLEWNYLPFKRVGHENDTNAPVKPKNFEKMVRIACELSQGIPHVRVDLYNVDGKIYFGEFTFFTGGGMGPFQPEEWDYRIGSLLHLPQV